MKKSLFLLLSILCFSALTIEAKPVEKHPIVSFQKGEAMALTYITETQFIAMMSEQDFSDLLDNLEGTDRSNLIEEVNKEAVSIINPYLKDRYTLPVNGSDEYLTTICKDLMVYRLYKRRNGSDVPDNILKEYRNLRSDLKDIANNTVSLSIEREGDGGSGTGTNVSSQNIQVAHREKIERYRL